MIFFFFFLKAVTCFFLFFIDHQCPFLKFNFRDDAINSTVYLIEWFIMFIISNLEHHKLYLHESIKLTNSTQYLFPTSPQDRTSYLFKPPSTRRIIVSTNYTRTFISSQSIWEYKQPLQGNSNHQQIGNNRLKKSKEKNHSFDIQSL